MKRSLSLLFGVCLLSTMTACDKKTDGNAAGSPVTVTKPSAAQIAFAAKAIPTDPALAAVYERSCKTCHSAINTNAPLTGHVEAWKARSDAKGKSGLLASTQNGLNAMPAKGLCPDCTDDQLTALIDFMSAGEN